MKNFTPKEIVSELDKNIIGQENAKKLVSIALRNRWRRKQLPDDIQQEIMPKNILMIGSTGVGKTEIARRLAKLDNSPFIKVEATKFTEIGYVGRDVEQIIRDLAESAINMYKQEKKKSIIVEAEKQAINKIINIIAGEKSSEETKNIFRKKLNSGELQDTEIEITLRDKPATSGFDIPGMQGAIGMISLDSVLGKEKTKTRKLKIPGAIKALTDEESDKLLDKDEIIEEALALLENNGIVFIDEIDKITSNSENRQGNVSREGVQRDLLPLVEGTTVNTKYGPVKTDHILFIASGAFHLSKPSDLLPELQGRFPIRVELHSLTKEDFKRILTEPQFNLIIQTKEMLKAEGIELIIEDEAIDEITEMVVHFNNTIENIGARRLHTVMEKVLEEINFIAPDLKEKKFVINRDYVKSKVGEFTTNIDLSKYII